METIKCESVSFTYPTRAEKALDNVSFSLKSGECCAVLGASGSGKSTLLKLLKTEIAPHGKREGSVQVQGSVGYVSQHFEESIVCDNVYAELAFSPTHAGMSAEETALAVAETAAYFHLSDKLNDPVSNLSGGEKQLLCLAAVMVMKPALLVLDEPMAQLDPVGAAAFFDMLRSVHTDFGTTVLMAAHSLQYGCDLFDSVLLLEGGKCRFKTDLNAAAAQMTADNNPMAAAFPARMTKDALCAFSRAEDAVTLPAKPVLECREIYFAYRKGEDVLRGASLMVYPGIINAVIGENGCGKTTLLKVLCGIRKPYRGKVKTRQKIAMLPQNVYDLFTRDTCGEEVGFGELTDRLGIADIEHSHPYDISGGQAQRLALAKVLQTGADILLLDEPTKGLDPVLKEALGALLSKLCSEGKTVVLVTHDLAFAGRYADAASLMCAGTIAATMPAPVLFRKLRFYTTPLSRLTGGELI